MGGYESHPSSFSQPAINCKQMLFNQEETIFIWPAGRIVELH